MAGKRMIPRNLARAGLLEPFGRTLMCLQLRHFYKLVPGGFTTFSSIADHLVYRTLEERARRFRHLL